MIQRPFPALGIGWLLALIGLVVVIVIKIGDAAMTTDKVLALFALAFLAILL